jgi:hypothetical protein
LGSVWSAELEASGCFLDLVVKKAVASSAMGFAADKRQVDNQPILQQR